MVVDDSLDEKGFVVDIGRASEGRTFVKVRMPVCGLLEKSAAAAILLRVPNCFAKPVLDHGEAEALVSAWKELVSFRLRRRVSGSC